MYRNRILKLVYFLTGRLILMYPWICQRWVSKARNDHLSFSVKILKPDPNSPLRNSWTKYQHLMLILTSNIQKCCNKNLKIRHWWFRADLKNLCILNCSRIWFRKSTITWTFWFSMIKSTRTYKFSHLNFSTRKGTNQAWKKWDSKPIIYSKSANKSVISTWEFFWVMGRVKWFSRISTFSKPWSIS